MPLKACFHMPLKACAYRKRGMMLLLRGFARDQFIRGVCAINTRAYLVRVSDQRGTCLEENLQSVVCVCNSPLVATSPDDLAIPHNRVGRCDRKPTDIANKLAVGITSTPAVHIPVRPAVRKSKLLRVRKASVRHIQPRYRRQSRCPDARLRRRNIRWIWPHSARHRITSEASPPPHPPLPSTLPFPK